MQIHAHFVLKIKCYLPFISKFMFDRLLSLVQRRGHKNSPQSVPAVVYPAQVALGTAQIHSEPQ